MYLARAHGNKQGQQLLASSAKFQDFKCVYLQRIVTAIRKYVIYSLQTNFADTCILEVFDISSNVYIISFFLSYTVNNTCTSNIKTMILMIRYCYFRSDR